MVTNTHERDRECEICERINETNVAHGRGARTTMLTRGRVFVRKSKGTTEALGMLTLMAQCVGYKTREHEVANIISRSQFMCGEREWGLCS